MGIKSYTKERFCKVAKTKVFCLLPSVLAIYADMVDIHDSVSDTRECKVDVINYPFDMKYSKYSSYKEILTQVYFFCDEHKLIFKSPKDLPLHIRIDNKPLAIRYNPNLTEDKKMSETIIGEVILRHYVNIQWYDYCCPIESYVDILASLFFFCPDILWCAIVNEIQSNQIDYNVKKAVNRCLNLLTLFDQMIRKHPIEICEYTEDALKIISNECQITEIEQVVLQNHITSAESINRVEAIVDLATTNFRLLCERMCKQSWKKRRVKKFLGKLNYKCIFNTCKSMPNIN